MTLCNVTFSFVCSQEWHALEVTSDPLVGHCAKCQTKVHMVLSEDQVEEHRVQGHCVALYDDYAGEVGTMGMLVESSSESVLRFDPILLRPIEELELPTTVTSALADISVCRVGDLIQIAEADLAKVKGITFDLLQMTKEALASRALILGTKLDGWI